MKKQRLDGRETRRKLLASASEVFAQKGFWEATNADICEKADANTALINYHFGSKENLYIEAWKYAFSESITKHPPDGGVSPDAPAEDKLRGKIFSLMERIIDPQAFDFDIIHKEMANPTGLLTETIETAIGPIGDDFKNTLREVLGEGVSEKQLNLCHMSIMGQCFGPMLHLREHQKTKTAPKPRDFPEFTIKELAEHITRFSLAGMTTYME